MEGVTVLYEEVESGAPLFFPILFFVSFAAILTGIILLVKDNDVNFFVAILFLHLVISGGLGVLTLITHTQGQYTVYTVMVSESVSLVEFNEKYEVIDPKGLIYDVREK